MKVVTGLLILTVSFNSFAGDINRLINNRFISIEEGNLKKTGRIDGEKKFFNKGPVQYYESEVEKRSGQNLIWKEKYNFNLLRLGNDVQRIVEAESRDKFTGVEKTIRTHVFDTKAKLISATECGQSTESNTPILSWRDENTRCTTFTKNFCDKALEQLKINATESEITFCNEVMKNARDKLQKFKKDLSSDKAYQSLASEESKYLSEEGIKFGQSMERPLLVFTSEKKQKIKSGPKAIEVGEFGPNKDFSELGYIGYVFNTCNKLSEYFDGSQVVVEPAFGNGTGSKNGK